VRSQSTCCDNCLFKPLITRRIHRQRTLTCLSTMMMSLDSSMPSIFLSLGIILLTLQVRCQLIRFLHLPCQCFVILAHPPRVPYPLSIQKQFPSPLACSAPSTPMTTSPDGKVNPFSDNELLRPPMPISSSKMRPRSWSGMVFLTDC
jgi:hypothetical protein